MRHSRVFGRFSIVACCLATIQSAFLLPGAAADEPAEAPATEKQDVAAPAGTPLDEAVAKLNEQIARDLDRLAADSPRPDQLKQVLRPISAADVVAAIRDWDRKQMPVNDETYGIFQRIAETQMLPPRSEFELRDQWIRRGEHDCRLSRVMLNVMTGESTGYVAPIRDLEIQRRQHCPLPHGYQWLVRSLQNGRGGFRNLRSGDLKTSFHESADDLVVTVERSYDVFGVNVIAFDEQGNPYRLACKPIGAYSRYLAERFRLDPNVLPRDKVADVAIQGVTQEGIRAIARIEALRAESNGVSVLPLPEIGKAYEFSLLIDDQALDSRSLRGKVVLIDLWGSWCAPCLKKMPQLKEIYAKYHDQGLEVLGVSFDDHLEDAQRVIEQMKIPWKSVNMPRETKARDLWQARDRATLLPTVLLIDRQGVLRYELFSGDSVEEKVEELLSGDK